MSHYRRTCKSYQQICKNYQWAITLAQEDWKLLVDGIVTALRYNTIKSHFIAKLNYSNNGIKKTEELIIPVEWVSDVYGPEVMSKLVD